MYGLAGYSYSDGIDDQPGGREIVRWAFSVPVTITLLALLVSAMLFSFGFRPQNWAVVAGVCFIHLAVTLVFLASVALFYAEIIGVFI